MKTVVLLLLDAFSDKYLSPQRTPFLHDMASHGFGGTIQPLFGYRAIEATLFSGTWPETHGVWTELRLAHIPAKAAPEALWVKTMRLTEFIPGDRWKLIARNMIHRAFPKSSFFPYLIPSKLIGYFEASMRESIVDEGALGRIPTLFDWMRGRGLRFHCSASSMFESNEAVVNRFVQRCKKGTDFHFYYLKLGLLDTYGHKYGPESEQLKRALSDTDLWARRVFEALQKGNKNFTFVVMSDHGMCQVRETINMEKILSKVQVRLLHDYLVFFDSTMAKFWFFDESVRETIERAVSNINKGRFLSLTERKTMKLSTDRKYGDLIYALDEGNVIYPDFFHRSQPVRGMHGYAFPQEEGRPIFLCLGAKTTLPQLLNFTDIMPWFIQELSDTPEANLDR